MTTSVRPEAVEAANALRGLLIAGEQFRRALASSLGVGISEAAAMTYLSADGIVTPRQLARRMGVTPSAVTAILDRLEAHQLIERRKHPTDRRQLAIVPTESGRKAILRAATYLAAAAARPDAEALAQTCEAIRRITGQLERHAGHLAASSRDSSSHEPGDDRLAGGDSD